MYMNNGLNNLKINKIMEQELKTIREIVKRYYEDNIDESNIPREHYEWEIQDLMIGFAYQWQQERSYSEEEVLSILQKYRFDFSLYRNIQVLPLEFSKWFEQFKKK